MNSDLGIIFMLINDSDDLNNLELLVYNPFDGRSDNKWPEKIYGIDTSKYSTTIRGYIKDGSIGFFDGYTFDEIKKLDIVIKGLKLIKNKFGINVSDYVIHNGMIMTENGLVPKTKCRMNIV